MKYIFILLFSIFLFKITCHDISIAPKKIVTNPERADGFGAQFQTIMYSVMYAELTNKKYVYTPFAKIEHNYHNNPDYIAQKEWLINFIDTFESNNNNEATRLEASSLIRFFESNMTECLQTQALATIKKIFRENKEKERYFTPKNFNIAIHIRRPNLHDSRVLGTDIPDMIFLDSIKNLRIVYAEKNPIFHIYSQGDLDNFKEFEAEDIILHINKPIEDTFISMVFADVLVISPSSFSYTAAVISHGIIYYIPFWHLPLPHWISIDTLNTHKLSLP